MVTFELATPARILFGAGRLADAPAEIAALGVSRALVVTGRSGRWLAALEEPLRARGVGAVPFGVAGEPTLDTVREGVALALAERCDGVVGLGGGSAVDAAKAIAALVANGGDPLDYVEVVGRGRQVTRASAPFVAIPTTAGTGSEVTRNAVLGAPDAGVKASLRSPLMLARVAIVDPDLLLGAPPDVVAASGLDAFSQLVEPWLSARANPFTDALARDGIARSVRSLRAAHAGASDAGTREDLALASLFGGLCLANGGLGAVHGFAAPAGAMFSAPHGAVCAALLAACLEVNLRALRARAPGHPSVARFDELARWLTGRPGARAEDAVAWVAELCRALDVPGLSRHGMTAADVPALVQRARAASSMKANPIALTQEELVEIAERSMGPLPA
jgi:alcohol dehydrogenase class IV